MNGFMLQGRVASVKVADRRPFNRSRPQERLCDVRIALSFFNGADAFGDITLVNRSCHEFVAGTDVRVAIDEGEITHD